MNSLLSTIFPAAASALSLAGLLALALRMQKITRSVVSEPNKPQDLSPGIVADLSCELMLLSERISLLESSPVTLPDLPSVTIRSGMNLNKRTQALRQYRIGQSSEEIAKSLDMPKAEMDLLLKVHRMISSTSVSEPRP